ncbi:MAG: response regulator [bacterium]
MKILIADDDQLMVKALREMLGNWGYEVIVRSDGTTAWELLQEKDAPALALVDRLMPGIDGTELCSRVRANEATRGIYMILLTGLGSSRDIVKGLESGADDYVVKPFEEEELRVRIAVGVRIVNLQRELVRRLHELEEAAENINQLQGLLPICTSCKKIRDSKKYWHRIEDYISKHAGVKFTHGYCPECHERVMKEIV